MSNSLYKISTDILDLFSQIEDQEGEMTKEQEENLVISETELKEKLQNYCNAIQNWTADIKGCKEEEKRIAAVRKKYENRISHLKSSMLMAVQTFGSEGKTNKFIELPTVRVFTKSTPSVKIDETRINIFISEFERYIRELVSAGILTTGQDVDMIGILDSINANVKATYGDDFIPFTINDLCAIKLEFSTTMSIVELFQKGYNTMLAYAQDPINTKIEQNILKDDLKTIIKSLDADIRDPLTIAEIVSTESIQMK